MTDGSKAIVQMKKFLDQQGWKYLVDEKETLRGLVTGEKGRWHWVGFRSSDGRFLVFHACSPMNVLAGRLAAAAEYLARANWGLQFGNFDMDWSDGQVIFRTSVPIATTGVSVKTIEHLVFSNCALMDRYLPGLLAVSVGDVNPEKAVSEAERDLRSPGGDAGVPAESTVGEHPASPDAATETPGNTTPGRLNGFLPSDN